ncbi:hypothetical protein LNQ03_12560 [Klebsiella pneumoniae subsp. pneumoniae]|nr:hypothetical protein [Klebsiella pneumoniae subsp. pneumoniae]
MIKSALLVLEDGTQFHGRAIGATGTAVGEVVFNTSMTGYQEILTLILPIPAKSSLLLILILVMSAPTPPMKNLLRYMRRGLVIRDLPLIASNFRST